MDSEFFKQISEINSKIIEKHIMEQQKQNSNAELTYGQKAAGVTFNPSNDPRVDSIKLAYANLIDALDMFRNSAESSEAKRHFSIAITEAENSQMRAVKALTWRY